MVCQQGGCCRMTWTSMQQHDGCCARQLQTARWLGRAWGRAKEGEEDGLACSEPDMELSLTSRRLSKDERVNGRGLDRSLSRMWEGSVESRGWSPTEGRWNDNGNNKDGQISLRTRLWSRAFEVYRFDEPAPTLPMKRNCNKCQRDDAFAAAISDESSPRRSGD